MILFADGLKKIRRNLEEAHAGLRPKAVGIGKFTLEELKQINSVRTARGFSPLQPKVIFHGFHLYKSRCVENDYTIEQVMIQIASALCEASLLEPSHASLVLRNPNGRIDEAGKFVHDEAVFECTGHFPFADLFSVIPRGDGKTKAKN
jgi:hypothetical protein